MITQPYLRNLSPGVQLLAFMLIVLMTLSLMGFLGLTLVRFFTDIDIVSNPEALDNFEEKGSLAARRIMMIVNQLGLFLIPSILFGMLVSEKQEDYLHARKLFTSRQFILALVIAISSFIPVNFLAALNQKMTFPEGLEGIEIKMKMMEEQTAGFINSTLGHPGLLSFIINLLMLAIIPAIGEEFFFRGVLQQLFNRILRNPHIAIWVTAFVFSFIHMQFYGFVPRFLLGALLGYVYFWTANIWMPVILHFVNNTAAVAISYLIQNETIPAETENYGGSVNEMIPLVLSTLILAGSIYLIGKKNSMSYWRTKTES